MTLRELVDTCTFKDIAPILTQLFRDREADIPRFKILFDGLRFREIIPSNDKIIISKSSFSTEEKTYYNVCLLHPDEPQKRYGLCGMRTKYLSMEVVLEEGIFLSNAEIVANCILEMTFYGSDDEEIHENLKGKIEDTEEFRMANALNYKRCLFEYPESAKNCDRKKVPDIVVSSRFSIVEEDWDKERAMNGPKRKRMHRWKKRIKYLERRSKIKLAINLQINRFAHKTVTQCFYRMAIPIKYNFFNIS